MIEIELFSEVNQILDKIEFPGQHVFFPLQIFFCLEVSLMSQCAMPHSPDTNHPGYDTHHRHQHHDGGHVDQELEGPGHAVWQVNSGLKPHDWEVYLGQILEDVVDTFTLLKLDIQLKRHPHLVKNKNISILTLDSLSLTSSGMEV